MKQVNSALFVVLMIAALILCGFSFANAQKAAININDTIPPATLSIPTVDDDGFGIVLQEVYFVDGEPMLYGKHVDFDSETADFMRYVLSDGCLVDTTKYPIAAVAYDDGYRYWVELD
jgi:hypothetical protein